ncbi:MAG: ABC transporter substrate-binding protein [Solirubrobacterales bacterium]
MSRLSRSVAASVLLLALLPACASSAPTNGSALGDDAITVGSFNFPESVLLGELYAQALETAGYRVVRELNLGTRELVAPAVIRGLVELVPEYSGSALEFVAGPGTASPDPKITSAALAAELASRNIVALDPSPAEDRNGVVVTAETAAALHLTTLSDLARVSETLTFGGPPECPARPLCLIGLETAYGIHFGTVVSLDEGGPLTVAALLAGDIDVGLLFTSDGAIRTNDFVLLEDDRHLQPAENITPVLRPEVLARFGDGVAVVLNAVSAELTTEDLRAMNASVVSGVTPAEVAAAWLTTHGFRGIESPPGV